MAAVADSVVVAAVVVDIVVAERSLDHSWGHSSELASPLVSVAVLKLEHAVVER